MALEKITHIEGLDSGYEDLDLMDDTQIGVTRVKFYLKSEDMPFLSEQSGTIVRHNFVWVEKIVNLGNLIIQARCKDKVEFDAVNGKWKVKKLAAEKESDIRKYPNEWNAFSRGAASDIIGTPLNFLFKNDPSKCEGYKAKHIQTIEQLSQCTDAHIQEIGFGGRQDVEMARYYLKKIQEQAPAIELNNKFEEKDREISDLRRELGEAMKLVSKLLESKEVIEQAPKVTKTKTKQTPSKEFTDFISQE